MGDFVQITPEPLSLDTVIASIGHKGGAEPRDDAEAGALVTFSGIVRATEEGQLIPALEYEHYAGMAEREMARLVERARERWPLRAVALIHRIGTIAVGEPSVIVAVSAGHRAEAFEAARFLIDELKQSVPIWKAPGRA